MGNIFHLKKYVVVFDEGVDQAAAIEALAPAGGRIIHRLGDRTVVIAVDLPADKISRALPVGLRLVAPDEKLGETALKQPVLLDAVRLRTSAAYRRTKEHRPDEGRDWGEGNLPAPDAPEDSPEFAGGFGAPAALGAPEITVPTIERLINDTAVGIVIVNGHNEFAISSDEKTNIVAEIQEGLDWLGSSEGNANVSWLYDVRETTVDITPWAGARWPGMPETFYAGIDAVFIREDNGKIYMFKGDQYVRLSNVGAGVDAGYPKPIAGNWPGMPADFNSGIDAALWRQSNGKIYFFKGPQYVRFTNVTDGVDAGYPKPIAGNWPGLPADFNAGIDAALLRKDNSKIYLFKNDQYVCYTNVDAGLDAGYPKPIADNWPGLPDKFKEGIDAAFWRNSDSRIYFFKNKRKNGHLYGSFVRFTKVSDGVDPGYENGMPIGLSTSEAELLWRDPAMAKLGYPSGADGVAQLTAEIRSKLNTQWAYCIFVTKYPTAHSAYASGGEVVIHGDDFTVGANPNLDRTVSHETGHIFGAPDEYASSNCSCGSVAGRFFKAPNSNCANCSPDPKVPCIMRGNSGAMCTYTPWHLGWGAFLAKIDAAVWRLDNNKLYLFSNDQYIRFTDVSAGRDEGYPKDIAGNWPGLPAAFEQGIDAALWRADNNKLYMFKGNQYVRFSNVGAGVDSGYPKPIAGSWPGMPAAFNNGIDAAFWCEANGKIYMFKGNLYVRFSDVSAGVDPGYPKTISGNWLGVPSSFNNGIDAALMRYDNHRVYFFKGARYVRFSDINEHVDAGYPKYINVNWLPFPK